MLGARDAGFPPSPLRVASSSGVTASTITLDTLWGQPALAQRLSPEEFESLYDQWQDLGRIFVRTLLHARRPLAVAEADVISESEAARILGMSARSLRRRRAGIFKALRVDNGTRKILYSRRAILEFLARR